MKKLNLPLSAKQRDSLKAGEMVLLSGVMYTARDAAHKRLIEMLDRGETLPLPLVDQTIYYVGPTPAPQGHLYGSARTTPRQRLVAYAPRLYDLGVGITIGKGYRTAPVREACVRNHALYLVAIGGAGALLGKCVQRVDPVAFEDLGAEAITRIEVKDFPATVAIDTAGSDVYAQQR